MSNYLSVVFNLLWLKLSSVFLPHISLNFHHLYIYLYSCFISFFSFYHFTIYFGYIFPIFFYQKQKITIIHISAKLNLGDNADKIKIKRAKRCWMIRLLPYLTEDSIRRVEIVYFVVVLIPADACGMLFI